MKVRLLPSSPQPFRQAQELTTYLIDDALAIDAGSVGLALPPEAMRKVRDVVITHAHIDHIASLPILVAEVFDTAHSALNVHALPEVIVTLRKHIFNNEIWPDFEQIQLPGTDGPALKFHELRPGEAAMVGAYRVTPVPVNHTVPTVGVFVEHDQVQVGLTSDTYTTDRFWEVARESENLRAIFVDVSYPGEFESLAALAKHLTPMSLQAELRKLDREIEIYAVHVKRQSRGQVERELDRISPPVPLVEIDQTYEWTR